MFCEASSFNHPIGGWEVSNVEDMGDMLQCAVSFNQPIGGLDVSNVRRTWGACSVVLHHPTNPLMLGMCLMQRTFWSIFDDCPILPTYKPRE